MVVQVPKVLEVIKWVGRECSFTWIGEGMLGRGLIYLASLGCINIVRN